MPPVTKMSPCETTVRKLVLFPVTVVVAFEVTVVPANETGTVDGNVCVMLAVMKTLGVKIDVDAARFVNAPPMFVVPFPPIFNAAIPVEDVGLILIVPFAMGIDTAAAFA